MQYWPPMRSTLHCTIFNMYCTSSCACIHILWALGNFFHQKAANQNFTSHKQIWYNKCSYYSPGSESEITSSHLTILWFYLQAVHLVLGLFIPGGWEEPLSQFVVFWFLCLKSQSLCPALLLFWLVLQTCLPIRKKYLIYIVIDLLTQYLDRKWKRVFDSYIYCCWRMKLQDNYI